MLARLDKWRAFDNVLTNHPGHCHHHIQFTGCAQQRLGMDGLDVAGPRCGQGTGPLGRLRRRLCAQAHARQIAVDDLERPVLDPAHDLVDLDRVGQVMDEEHQHQQAEEEQHQGDGDSQPRVLVGAPPGRQPDCVETGRAVGERRHEDAQHDLVDPVPQEVPEQPRRELRRRELQGHDGES